MTPDQVRQFDQLGYVLVPDAFHLDTVATVRLAIDEWEAETETFLRAQPDGSLFIATAGQITFTVHLVTRCAEARAFVAHPTLAGIARDLIGPNVRLYWDQAVYKKPELTREFPWHQDNGYAYVEPQQYLTCWVPLTDATLDNGCPWVMPGGHLLGTLPHRATPVGFQCLDDASGAVPVEAPAGSVVVFSSLTPHRTGPNGTPDVRKAYIVQYAPDGAEVVRPTGERVPQRDPNRQFLVVSDGQLVSQR
jgi:ectoine hydroxylase-related dioxygenase (phytanoyl-CoA dioxygenase family)